MPRGIMVPKFFNPVKPGGFPVFAGSGKPHG
jgi:hypothetical protein